MARVRDVDPAMLKRTQDFLMSRRDGKGGFLRNPAAIDSFGRAPDDVTNAYIVWALTESGKDDDLTKELNTLGEQAKTSKDPYFLSLVANSLINRARTDEGVKLLQTVAGAQKEDGHLDAEKTSITGSGGRDLEIETTALAVLGWLKANPGTFNAPLQKAVKWIGQQRGGYGGFGSTQSTILALKALIAYTKANKRTADGGEIRLYVGDKEEAKLPFAPGAAEALTLALPDAEKTLKPGANAVRVEITGKNTFPYTLAWTYQTLKPASADDCPVRLETKLSQTEVQEGGLVRLNMTLKNVSGKGQGMATVILGLPGGLTVPEDMKQLKQYTRVPEDGSRPLVSAFEIRGRELVLYWRDLAPEQTIQVPLDLIARIPGEYSGPASRGYLYYNADHKHWVEPLRVKIAAKME
jgi:alpha-2-macroglobulin-like protein